MIRTPLRPLARILNARQAGENPDAIEAENKRIGAQIGARLATELDKGERADRQKGADIGLKIAEGVLRDASSRNKGNGNGSSGES